MSYQIFFIGNDSNKFRKFLLHFRPIFKAKIIRYFDLLEKHGPILGMPFSKKIINKVWELRIIGKNNFRIFYTFNNKNIYILAWLMKKKQKLSHKKLKKIKQRLTRI